MNFMGIDIGTTSIKTAVFDEKLEEKISLSADRLFLNPFFLRFQAGRGVFAL